MALGGDVRKMKKLGIVVALLLVIAMGISSASALVSVDVSGEDVWEKYFPNNETDVPEKQELPEEEEIKKDWEIKDEKIFPEGYFNVTPREEWTDKPANWFDVTSEGLSNKPEGYWDVNWGIPGIE